MKKLVSNQKAWFYFGLVLVLVSFIPYFILKDEIVFTYHDEWDGEVLAYLFHAKYLFKNVGYYQELMNGIQSTGLTPPAMLPILLYKIFRPFTAFVVNYCICVLIGYIGMYKCGIALSNNSVIAFTTALCFSFLPLFSVYGLAQFGLPLLLVVSINLWKKEKKVISFIYIAIYGFYSSLVLIGYAILGFTLLGLIYLVIKKKIKEHIDMLFAWLILLASYILTNLSLLLQIFGVGEQVPSHKEDLVRYGMSFWTGFSSIFFNGGLHTNSKQLPIVILSTLIIVVMSILYKKLDEFEKSNFKLILCMYLFQVFCCAVYGVTHTEFITQIRNAVGGIIQEFQFDRVYWLTVPIWYFILCVFLKIVWYEIEKNKNVILKITYATALTLSICIVGINILRSSDFKNNFARMVFGEKAYQVTWKDFYATDIYDEIKKNIRTDYEAYRVLSFGMHPAAALYNGFYCLDGYSNNYSKEYKNEFRNIIAGELSKDEGLRLYYDNWGCRCYLLTAPYASYNAFIHKGSGMKVNPDFDMNAAKKMGAKYIFSAVEFDNAENLGITLLSDKPFSTEDSYYEIYVYEID